MASKENKETALASAIQITKEYAGSSSHGAGRVEHVLEKVYEMIVELREKVDKD
jgi:hypothetical protein